MSLPMTEAEAKARGQAKGRPHMTTETLRRRIVEAVGDVRHGQPMQLQQGRCMHEAHRRQIPFRGREAAAEEP